MTPRKVIIFGGTGFVGRYLTGPIADRGARVAVGSRWPEHGKHLQPCGNVGQVVSVAADIRNEPAVRAVVRGADFVINLVGILCERGRSSFQSIHVDGAAQVARVAREEGVPRLLHMSALGAGARSASHYARSKAAGEAAVRAAFPGAVIFRPSIIVGPEDGFFNRFAGMARLSPGLPLIGGGRTRFQPIYVADVAAAVMAVIDDPATEGATFELGGPVVYSFADLMELMLAVIERRRWLVPVPFWLASLLATPLGLLPKPPLTRDQVRQLKSDNVLGASGDAGAKTLAELGLTGTAIEAVLDSYLLRYRPGGRRAGGR